MFQLAQRHTESGQPAALLEVKLPLPMLITAGGYLEKYGPDERYNYLHFVPGVPCPTLLLLGRLEVESNMAFREAPQALAKLAAKRPNLVVETIEGADHFYTGARDALGIRLEAWLRRLPS